MSSVNRAWNYHKVCRPVASKITKIAPTTLSRVPAANRKSMGSDRRRKMWAGSRALSAGRRHRWD